MEITLIQPRKPVLYSTKIKPHWELTRPFALFSLAAFLEKNTNCNVEILDLEQEKYKDVSLEDILGNNNSDIFGITAATYTRFEAINIAKYIKKFHRHAWVIVGGPHFMHCAVDTLHNVPEIDVVVRGEGEVTIVELVRAISEGSSIKGIKGITYRNDDGRIIVNPDQDSFEDLDSAPFFTRFTWDEYPEYLFGYPRRIRAISVMSSRGCPYKCIFCSKAGMKYRLRDAKTVVNEIEFLKKKFDIQGINFLDLTFTANPNHVKQICQEMIDRNINLKWWCESRANVPLDILDIMKQAGCVSLVIGVESGSPRVLAQVSKDISIEQVVNFCKKCHSIGIIVTPYFMFSHPGETKDDIEQTLDLICKLEEFTADCAFQPCMIFPGTEIEKIAYKNNILPKDFSWSYPYHAMLNLKLGQLENIPLFIDKLTPEELNICMEKRLFRLSVNSAAKMNISGLFLKLYDLLKDRKSSLKYLFYPRFYYEYYIAKFKRQR